MGKPCMLNTSCKIPNKFVVNKYKFVFMNLKDGGKCSVNILQVPTVDHVTSCELCKS